MTSATAEMRVRLADERTKLSRVDATIALMRRHLGAQKASLTTIEVLRRDLRSGYCFTWYWLIAALHGV